jgi:Fic family protein
MASFWIWQQPDWPQFRWDGIALESLLGQARVARQELLSRLQTLEPPLGREVISTLLSRESLGTAAIEGELLDPGQVRSSIARRLQLPLAEGQTAASAQVEGLLDVLLEATSTLGAPLTLAMLHHWHRRLFAAGPDGLRAIRIGELRDEAPMQVLSGAIGRERMHFEAPPRNQLELQLEAFLQWINSPPKPLNGLLCAGLAHLWFLTLHPYEDGNGRLARAITDRLLAQACRVQVQQELAGRALGISAQILREREGYYMALERCQRGNLDVTQWLSWFVQQLTTAAVSHGAVINAVQRKAAFWWRHRRSGFNSRQQKLLNRLLDAESEGFTGGMTLRKAISLTQVSRATAWRDLAEMVAQQAIEPIGEGRSRAYRIRWPTSALEGIQGTADGLEQQHQVQGISG